MAADPNKSVPQPVSSYKDISVSAQYVQKEEYLQLIQERPVSTDIITRLPKYADVRVQAIERELDRRGLLVFDKVFNDPTGYFLFSRFLRSYPGHCPDHALFLKDDDAFQQMRFHNARFRVARLMFNKYLGPDLEAELAARLQQESKAKKKQQKPPKGAAPLPQPARVGVFEAIRKRNEEKRKGLIPTIVRSMSGRRMSKAAHDAAASGLPMEEKGEEKVDADRGASYKVQSDEKGTGGDLDAFGQDYDPQEKFEVSDSNAIGLQSDACHAVSASLASGKAPRNLFAPVSREIRHILSTKAYPRFLESDLYKTYIRTKVLEEQKVGVDDFTIIRVLGKGGFGTVYAVRKIDSGCIYAMKSINKRLIKHKKAVAMTMLERHSLSLIHSRFVCGLHYAFQDSTHLFLVLDLMTGGDLKFHLSKARAVSRANSRAGSRGSPRVIQPSIKSTGTPRAVNEDPAVSMDSRVATASIGNSVTQTNGPPPGFSEERARFHAAEILLGLESMHSKNIIFRDLKLENVLLSNEGHARLTDLGLVALYGKKKISHYAGTPGYIAPEVAMKKAYGPAVDMFSLGVTIYRMISGKKPFRGQTRQDFDRAVCQDEPVFDKGAFSDEAISLIQGLLCKDPEQRLGCGKGRLGTQAIKDHPFFASIDWGLLEVGYRDPPFTPSMAAVNTNTHIHESNKEKETAAQYNKLVLDEKFDKQIQNFDYVSKSAVRTEIVAALQKQEEEEREMRQAQDQAPNECCIIL